MPELQRLWEGVAKAEALPKVFSDLMRRCQIAAELPSECDNIDVLNLKAEMQKTANIGMVQNAICDVTEAIFLELDTKVINLPVTGRAS